MSEIEFRPTEVQCSNCEKTETVRWGFAPDGQPTLMEIPISWYMGIEAEDGKTAVYVFCSEKCGLASIEIEQ